MPIGYIRRMLVSEKHIKELVDKRVAEVVPGTIDSIIQEAIGAAKPQEVKTAIAQAYTKHLQQAQTELKKHVDGEVAERKPMLAKEISAYLRRGPALEALAKSAFEESIKGMQPAMFQTQMPEGYVGYKMVRAASFTTDKHERTYTNWDYEDAAKDCKKKAISEAQLKALKAGAMLGAEVLLVTAIDSMVISAGGNGNKREIGACATINVEFYRKNGK